MAFTENQIFEIFEAGLATTVFIILLAALIIVNNPHQLETQVQAKEISFTSNILPPETKVIYSKIDPKIQIADQSVVYDNIKTKIDVYNPSVTLSSTDQNIVIEQKSNG